MVAITEMTNWAVDLIDVHKTYSKAIHALRGVNIQVGRGEIFGLLGPNGAGKSTLVKIMMTVIRPTRAMGTLLGRPLGHRGKLARVGYLPENHRFPSYLTGAKLLHYYAALAKVSRVDRQERAAKWLDRVGMTQWANTRIDKYSKGMMQRLGIAQALMNNPELVVLDEPTDGLDPVARREVRQLLMDLRREGKTIFLNSHLLSELEMVCDRVAVLVNGLVARQGPLGELTERAVEYRIFFSGDAEPVRAKIETLGAKLDRCAVSLPGNDLRKVNEIIDLLRGQRLTIEGVQPQRFSLEDVLLEAVGGGKSPADIPLSHPVQKDVKGQA
ncbi:MAG: ABC transporter ATP-binding protein [Planctomycetota bacterium]